MRRACNPLRTRPAHEPLTAPNLSPSQAEAQPLLLQRVDTSYLRASQLGRLKSSLIAHAHLRPLVKEMAGGRTDWQCWLLGNLHLVPQLRRISTLAWPPDVGPRTPAQTHRLPLLDLGVAAARNGTGDDLSLAAWFDLASLRSCSIHIDPSSAVIALSIVALLPSSLKSLAFGGFQALPYELLVRTSGQCTGLVDLTVASHVAPRISASDTHLLALFPALRSLDVRECSSPTALLAVPHSSLRRLSVGTPYDARWRGLGFPASHPLHVFVDALCHVLQTDRASYPALRTVGLIGGLADLRFQSADGRRQPGVREMARKIRAVGLRVLNQGDVEWLDEWSADGA